MPPLAVTPATLDRVRGALWGAWAGIQPMSFWVVGGVGWIERMLADWRSGELAEGSQPLQLPAPPRADVW